MNFYGPEQTERGLQSVLEQELPNARAALEWASANQEAELGLKLAGFTRLWHIIGQMSEAERWLKRMLALDEQARRQNKVTAPLKMRIERLYGLARTQIRQGQADETALASALEALELARTINDRPGMSNAFATLGMVAQATNSLDEAQIAYKQSLDEAQLLGHKGLTSRAFFHLAEVAQLQGNFDQAATLLEEALGNARASQMHWDIAIIHTLLGHLARDQRAYSQAHRHYYAALTHYQNLISPFYSAKCLEGLVMALYEEGEGAKLTPYLQIIRLYAGATNLRHKAQTPLPQAEQKAFNEVLATARADMGEKKFSREWGKGICLNYQQLIEEALAITKAQFATIHF